jgi:hypothetical protein
MKSDLSSLEMQQVSYLLLGRCVKLLGLSHDACDMPTIETVTIADKQRYEYNGDVNKWHSPCLSSNSFNTYAVS